MLLGIHYFISDQFRLWHYPSPLLAPNHVMGYIWISDILRYCDLDMDNKGKNLTCELNMVSGSLPIEFGRAQGVFFSGKMAISDSGSKFLDSGRTPKESGHAQGCFVFWKWQSGILKPILGFWKWLTDGSRSGYIRFVIPCNIQSIRGKDAQIHFFCDIYKSCEKTKKSIFESKISIPTA